MDKNREKIVERPQNKNLTPGGPGRPKGKKNFATLYRQAIENIAKSKGISADEFEVEMVQQAISKGFNGDTRFYTDTMDRVHGKAPQQIDHNVDGKIENININVITQPTSDNDIREKPESEEENNT